MQTTGRREQRRCWAKAQPLHANHRTERAKKTLGSRPGRDKFRPAPTCKPPDGESEEDAGLKPSRYMQTRRDGESEEGAGLKPSRYMQTTGRREQRRCWAKAQRLHANPPGRRELRRCWAKAQPLHANHRTERAKKMLG